MNLAKARQISESLHKLILYQVLTDDDLVKIGKIFIRALERAERIAIKQSKKKEAVAQPEER